MRRSTNLMMLRRFMMLGAISAAALLPITAEASLAVGTFTIGGSLNVSTGDLNFVGGQYTITAGSQQGGFPTMLTRGMIKDIDAAHYPVGTTYATPDFMTFNEAPNLSFTLEKLLPGIDGMAGCVATPSDGQVCTPSNSPYNLQNIGGAGTFLSNANFSISGIEVDSITGKTSPFSGIFSTTFTEDFQSVINAVNTGTVRTSYSGSFTVAASTPEPAFLLPLAGGLLMLIASLGLRARNRTQVRG